MAMVTYSKSGAIFGNRVAEKLATILPGDVCVLAGATCHFHVGGKTPEKNDDPNENAPATINAALSADMATMGKLPVFANDAGRFSESSNWVELRTAEEAGKVLACFGITLADFWEKYIKPGHPSLKYQVTLKEVVTALRPAMVA